MALLGGSTVSARSNSSHQRHRKFARVRKGADQFSAFLSQQATRLSLTTTQVFNDLKKNTARAIRNVANSGQLH
jgi:hypothetical protein